MDARNASDPSLSDLTTGSADRSPDTTRRPSVTVVSGEGQGPFVLPSLYSFDEPHRFGRVRAPVQWRALLAVVSVTGVATAGTVGGLWVGHARAMSESAPIVTPGDIPAPAPRFESIAATSFVGAPTARAVHAPPARTAQRGARTIAPVASVASVRSAAGSVAPDSAPQPSCTQACGLDVQCILHCPGGEGTRAVPLQPSRDQITAAMQQVRGAVMICGAPLTQGPRNATVTVTFDSAGGVADAEVAAPYGGSLPGDCIERAVRRAHVPRFSADEFSVTFPFMVR